MNLYKVARRALENKVWQCLADVKFTTALMRLLAYINHFYPY
jgi:hypothetical protein